MARLKVYVCRDPEHEKLVEMLRDILQRVKGKKPKLQVVRLKLERAGDFPAYLSQLEELFGGIATAEFRKYRIESLPAIVYNDQLVLQGNVPSLEELEEALAYAGLRFARERPAVQPQAQIQPLQQAQIMNATSAALRRETAKAREEAPAIRAQQAPPKIKILDRLPQTIEERKEARAEQKAETERATPSLRKQEEPTKPAPPTSLPRVTQEHECPPLPGLAVHDIIKREEILVNVPSAEAPRPSSRAKKTCEGCVFYDAAARRCLLLRSPILDPSKPICA